MNTEQNLKHPKDFESPLCAEVGSQFFFLDDEDDDTIDKETANTSYAIASGICKKCEHISDCAEWGIRREKWGFWGGLTPNERQAIRRKRNITLRDTQ